MDQIQKKMQTAKNNKSDADNRPTIAVVIPCYRVKSRISDVLAGLPDRIDRIYMIDDGCPQQSGAHVARQNKDPRLKIIYHEKNRGVGAAVVSGYRESIDDGCDIVVKIDGDGQMDITRLPHLLAPILSGRADYTKGNRFFQLGDLKGMPWLRIMGNSSLSLITKISSGYWNIMDPTNGYTAIHRTALSLLPLEKLDKRYFFESDMLFRLNTVRAVVQDIPMPSRYADNQSGLNLFSVLLDFPGRHLSRIFKRIFYTYLLRDFSATTVLLLCGGLLLPAGMLFGGYHWHRSIMTGIPATSGTVMIAALLLLTGLHLLIGALNLDIANSPSTSLQRIMSQGGTLPESPKGQKVAGVT
jgi:glycosyltransferase involved in cell wall biosynthesis